MQMALVAIGGIGVIAAAGFASVHYFHPSSVSEAPARPIDRSLRGVQAWYAPWPPEYTFLSDRLAPLGLHALGQVSVAVHIHSHLDMFVDGKRIVVPARIGINGGSYITEVSTRDRSGVIHVQSASFRTFTLGTFFGVWGVRLTSRCVGAYCEPSTAVRVYVDGKRATEPAWRIKLRAHEEIVFAIGRPPRTIASSYTFPLGE